jgi:hypothetical protein
VRYCGDFCNESLVRVGGWTQLRSIYRGNSSLSRASAARDCHALRVTRRLSHRIYTKTTQKIFLWSENPTFIRHALRMKTSHCSTFATRTRLLKPVIRRDKDQVNYWNILLFLSPFFPLFFFWITLKGLSPECCRMCVRSMLEAVKDLLQYTHL